MSWQGALSIVGTAVGSYFGGSIGGAIGGGLGSLAGAAIDGPEQIFFEQEGYRLDDLSLAQTTSTYGLPIPKIYGKSRVGGQLIWSSGLKETITTESETTQQGGKGDPGVETTTTTTTYTYSVDCALALCEGPIVGVTKIWADDQLIYDISTSADADTLTESLKLNDIITVYSGTETQLPNTLIQSYEGAALTPAHRGLAYIVFADLQLANYGNRIPQLSFEVAKNGSWSGDQITPENTSLSEVILDILDTTDLEESDVDVSLLTDEVVGFKINGKVPISEYINQLLIAYTMDIIESEGKIKFLKRGNDPIVDIPEADLCATDGDGGDILKINRDKESNLPRQVSISYYNPDQRYEISEQHVTRINVRTTKSIAKELSMILTDTEAIQLAEKMIYTSWISRTTYEFNLSFEYLSLEPGDVITVTYDGTIYTMRIGYMELGYPGIIVVKAIAEDSNTYISNAVGSSGQPISESISAISDTIVNFMDIPLLNDNDDGPGYYVGVCGETTSWNGCVIYKSNDAGLTYTEVMYTRIPTTMGVSLNTLSGSSQYIWDERNYVDVELYHGRMESRSADLVLNGANIGLLGEELIQWRNADLISTNTYRLSGLLRGCRGTEYAISTHVADESFVYLVPGTYQRVLSSYNEIGIPKYYKAVSYGNYTDSADAFIFINSAKGKRPLSPVHIVGERDGSGNLTISWVRRTRIGGEWRDYTDVPLGEATEQYYVDINSDGWETYYRTIGSTTTSCTYTAAQQIEDFGSTQSGIEITVYQHSQEIGYGFTSQVIV